MTLIFWLFHRFLHHLQLSFLNFVLSTIVRGRDFPKATLFVRHNDGCAVSFWQSSGQCCQMPCRPSSWARLSLLCALDKKKQPKLSKAAFRLLAKDLADKNPGWLFCFLGRSLDQLPGKGTFQRFMRTHIPFNAHIATKKQVTLPARATKVS